MSHDERIAILETTIQHTNMSLINISEQIRHLSDRMDKKFDKIDDKFEKIEAKMEAKFEAIDKKMWRHFILLMGMIIGLAGLVAHAHLDFF